MGTVGGQQFHFSAEVFNRVQVRALAWPLLNIHRVVPNKLLCFVFTVCLGSL